LCGWLNATTARHCTSCEKTKPREKKTKPSPVFRPWRAVVLALDTAENTGWSVWDRGVLIEHGEQEIYTEDGVREVIRIVETAKRIALNLDVHWVCMSERSWGGHMGTGATQAFGFWMFALRNAQLPRARIGQVYPATWRARVLRGGMHAAPREAVRACEVETASALVGRRVGNDQAAGILIGKWAIQAGETGELLPKNARVTV
jgi:hypothetical protein